MTTDIEALIAEAHEYAGVDEYGGAQLLRELADALESVATERDDLEGRLAELLCELTDGRMSKTGYDVKTMVHEIEATFNQAVQEDLGNAWNEAVHAREERDALRAIIDEALAEEGAMHRDRNAHVAHPLPRHHREGNRSMTTIDLDALETLARKATPGPWQSLTTGVRYGDHWYIADDGESIAYATKNDGDHDDKCRENAKFIAAANPFTVLTLIADLRRAQECIDATKNMLGDEKRNPAMRLLGDRASRHRLLRRENPMTTDELIERAAKAIWNQMSDDAQEYTRMQARAAFAVFEQAQPEPEWEYECKLDDSGWKSIDDVTHFQRCRGEGRRRRKAGPWVPV